MKTSILQSKKIVLTMSAIVLFLGILFTAAIGITSTNIKNKKVNMQASFAFEQMNYLKSQYEKAEGEDKEKLYSEYLKAKQQMESFISKTRLASSPPAGCGKMSMAPLDGVPSFPEVDELVVCSSGDSLTLLLYNNTEFTMSNIVLNIDFDPGLAYTGWAYTHNGNGTINELDVSNANSPTFLIGDMDGGTAVIVVIGMSADCNINIGFDNIISLDANVSYQYTDDSGATSNCTDAIEDIGEYNNGIKVPVLNMRNVSPSELNISQSGVPKCQTVTISQDGIEAFVENFYFKAEGITAEYNLESVNINGIAHTFTYDAATQTMEVFIEDGATYFPGNSNGNGDDLFDENEELTVQICYSVNGCIDEDAFIKYSAWYGCNGDVCFDETGKDAAVSFKPNYGASVIATDNIIQYGGICGDLLIFDINITSANTDPVDGLWQDMFVKLHACMGGNISLSSVTMNGQALPANIVKTVGSVLVLQLDSLTTDLDGANNGLEDIDGDGFVNDLPGGNSINFHVELEIGCANGSACSAIGCTINNIEVNGLRNCGQKFQDFGTLKDDNGTANPVHYFYGKTEDSNNTQSIPGYGIPITEAFHAYHTGWLPMANGFDYHYDFGMENITPCANPGDLYLIATITHGNIDKVPFTRYEEGSATYQGNAVAGVTSWYTIVPNNDGGQDTTALNIKIPAGDLNVNAHDYHWNLELLGDCFTSDYMNTTVKVIEECNSCGGTCEMIRSCNSMDSYIYWHGTNCACYFATSIDTLYRLNYGFADPEMTIPLTMEDVPEVDRTRFLPGDSIFVRYEMDVLTGGGDLLAEGDHLWSFRLYHNPRESRLTVNHQDMTIKGIYWWDSSSGEKKLITLPQCMKDKDVHHRDNFWYPSMTVSNGGADVPTSVSYGTVGANAQTCDDSNISSNYPWPQTVYYTQDQSIYDWYDINRTMIQFYFTNGGPDCGDGDQYDNECFAEWYAMYPVDDGDKIYIEYTTTMMHNPDYNLSLMNGTTFGGSETFGGAFYLYKADEDQCRNYRLAGSCNTNKAYQGWIPGPVAITNNVDVTDCDTRVEYEFTLTNPVKPNADLAPGETPWYVGEYRPFEYTEYLELQFPRNMAYLNDGTIVMSDGSEVPLPAQYIDPAYGNLHCIPANGGGVYCMAADQTDLAKLRINDADFNIGKNILYPAGPDGPNETRQICDYAPLWQKNNDPFPALIVENSYVSKYGLKYGLTSICPEEVSSTDFKLKYQFAEPYIPSLSGEVSGSFRTTPIHYFNKPNASIYPYSHTVMYPINPYAEYAHEWDGTINDSPEYWYWQKIIPDPELSPQATNPMRQTGVHQTTPDNFTDNSMDFPPLITDNTDFHLLLADLEGQNEVNTYKICAGDASAGGSTHQNVVSSIFVPNSVEFITATDENDVPYAWTLAQTLPDGKVYAVNLPDLPPEACATIKIVTELLFCPVNQPDANTEICINTTSGCLDPELASQLLAGQDGACDVVSQCYKYITQESDVQVSWDIGPGATEQSLCDEVEFGCFIKNVKPALLLNVITDWWFPDGLNFVPGSWQVSYPGGPNEPRTWIAIPDPSADPSQDKIYGRNFGYDEDADWSNYISNNGLKGIASTLDSNYIAFKFLTETECDEFTSGTSIWFQTEASDPCEATVSSQFRESDKLIIKNANPLDFPQFYVLADPLDLFCGIQDTLELTYINISPLGETDNAHLCIKLDLTQLSYTPGSVFFFSPAGYTPAFTETINGNIIEVCADIPDGIGPGEAFKVGFDVTLDENVDCGESDIAVNVEGVVEDQSCEAQGITCDVNVLESVNPVINVNFYPPVDVTGANLTVDCDNDVQNTTFQYSLDLHNGGPFYNNDFKIALYYDIDGNGEYTDGLDPLLDDDTQFVSLAGGADVTLTGSLTVPSGQACPVILRVLQTTNCVCDNREFYYSGFEPTFSHDLDDNVSLCPGDELGLDICSDFNLEVDPYAGADLRYTANNDSVYIKLNEGYGINSPVKLKVTSEIGACSSQEYVTNLWSLASFVLGPYDTTSVCKVGCAPLDLGIDQQYYNSISIEWIPSLYLDDPTSPTPIICNPQQDMDYLVNVTFIKDGQTCVFSARYPVVVEDQVIENMDDGYLCQDGPTEFVANDAFTNYIWYKVENGNNTIVQAGNSNTFTPTELGTYFVEYYNQLDVCKTRTNEFKVIECPDLALSKTVPDEAYGQGDAIPFSINVYNQSAEFEAYNVQVTDYIPSGLSPVAGLNQAWDFTDPQKPTTIITNPIPAGQSAVVVIYLEMVPGASMMDMINEAEISQYENVNGTVLTVDADSSPDNDPDNDNDVVPGSPDDNKIDGGGPLVGEDEDDNDVAMVPFFDLALNKTILNPQNSYNYGDIVTFQIKVCNQGGITANNIEIVDYIPCGFEFLATNEPLWNYNANSSTAYMTKFGNLERAECDSFTIQLKLVGCTEGGDFTNIAEIFRAENASNGDDMTDKDIDSTPDNDPTNDAGGAVGTLSDDTMDGDGTGQPGDVDPATDEDDADPAKIKVYDLALRKVLLTPAPYHYYDDLTFEITVFNQGSEVMKDIEISDYVPNGYVFDSGANPMWNGATPTITTVLNNPLNPGDSSKVQLVLKLVQTEGGIDDWNNYAEITQSFDNATGMDVTNMDIDSEAGSNTGVERAVKPGDTDDDNIDGHFVPDGTDEDDHDPAGIRVLDLALTKTTTTQAPFQYDQIVDFTLTIYNQGNEIAHDIEVVDYVPSGFIYLPHINPDWTQALVDNPSTTISTPLAPGESTTVTIKLQFQYTPEVDGYVNKAEIKRAKDESNEEFDDIDSTPDDDPDNDIGGTPLTPEDDNVSDDGKDSDEDGVTDEDDEDPWTIELASIGNYVWYDDNDNGIQDEGQPGDVGVAGVTVVLKDCDGKEILRTQTDENGHYDFVNLIPGRYMIVFEDLPEDSEWAKQNQGNDNLDSDADEDGVTICTELEAGEDDPNWDAGILRYSSLGDYVWLDTDSDGVQDPEEDQISGVVVKLLDENGNVLETTTTDEQGYYLFDSLHPGTYIVEFETPVGLAPTDKSQGGDLDKDSDPNPGTGKTDPIVLGANEDRRDIDAGYKCGLELDITPNDTLCEGESMEIEVTVIDGTGLLTYDWSTGEHTASITVEPTENTVYSVTVTDENGCSGIIKDTVYIEPRAKIGDYVWLDLDRDGIQDFYIDDPDLNEPGINGVTVNLYKADDPNTIYMTQLTHQNVDTSGYYEFDVCAGDYFVEFIPPTGEGYIFTQQDQGPDDTLDSDADENTGKTITFHVNPGDIDHTRDAGLYTTASIGDFVWHDIDADGIQDDGEEGIDGVEVTLHRADGSIVGTTTTSNGGKYEFTGLIPDDYYVCFDFSGTNYTQISPKDQGYDDTVDSDVDPISGCTVITEILAGENDVRWDMGLYTLASLGDYVWYDKDADGCQDADEVGIAGVTVRLYGDSDANGVPDGAELANTQTDNTGFYEFLELAAGTYVVKFEKPNSNYKVSPKNHNGADGCDDASDSDGNGILGYSDPIELSDNEHDPTIDQGYYETARLGDYVWYDKNGDGIQDPGEEGVSGVTVTLYKDTDGDGVPDTPVDTKVTNTGGSAGSYVFDDVEPGVYKICFDANGEYEGFTTTDQGGDDATDSDVDQQSGCTEVIVVESGDDDMTYDAGLIKFAELGDYVWEDKNADGVQDPTEDPIQDVMVILKDASGNPLDTSYTDATGLYLFDNLAPGDYIVEFRKPSGYKPTGKDSGTDDAKDSDASPVTGDSHTVTLEAGDSDMTIDAGFYKPASLGDYVWEDKDADGIQDPDEDGINGIVVTLYDENGDPVENTTTGVNPNTGDDGYYEFTDLEPGIYHVCFDKGSYDKISGKDVGSDNAVDSDADVDSGCTEIVVLESGEHDPTLDAGLYNLASLGDYVWLDSNADGIQDGSETGINDLIVELYIDEDGDGNPDDVTPLKTTTTSTNNGTDGYYVFEDLEPGNYIVKFPTVDAYEITKADEQGDDTKDSDADELTGWSATINLESGEHDPTIDAGYFNAASLGDYVWYDEDGDGIQDASEKCMDSVKIYLYRVIDNAGVLDTSKVDSTWSHAILNLDDITDTLNCGYYEFTRLIPGDYFLVFENPDDTKYQISPKDELFDDSKDTDINEFGNTPTITLAPGEHNPTIDAGFYKGECLEGVVWKDREEGYYEVQPDLTKLFAVPNVHDELDQPYPGLVVELYMDEDEFDPSDDVLVQTTVTDAEGVYNFGNIKRGNYYIVVNLPDDFELVNNDVGGDDTRDNDFYLSEETGHYRSYTFLIEADNDEECIEDIDAGTKERGQTQPITIVDFDAQWNKGEEVVELLWSSMDEIDMDYFDIERRAEDEEEFVNIGSVDSKGGRFLTKYGLKDPNVEGGMTYHYRLIPVNDNGRRDKVYNASVFIPADKFTVNAYPNPVMDRMYVLISGKRSNDVSIEILDNVGRRVLDKAMIEKSNTTYEKVSMNLRDLPQGQYYIKVVSGDRVEIKKLVHVR